MHHHVWGGWLTVGFSELLGIHFDITVLFDVRLGVAVLLACTGGFNLCIVDCWLPVEDRSK